MSYTVWGAIKVDERSRVMIGFRRHCRSALVAAKASAAAIAAVSVHGTGTALGEAHLMA